jgi:hypothetical protein
MDAAEIEALFTKAPGDYHFARLGRPIAPVVFGVGDATLGIIRDAIMVVTATAGQAVAETDPEIGPDFMVIFCRYWDELSGVPHLDRRIAGLGPLVARLAAEGANRYRTLLFDARGAICSGFRFLRRDAALASESAEALALNVRTWAMLLWSDAAFLARSPLARSEGQVALAPEFGALLRAAYDPALPAVVRDPSHALRLAARVVAAAIRR